MEDWTSHIPNGLGVVGVIIVMIAYFFLQIGKWKAEQAIYSILNLVGSALIIVSLIYDWNLPAFLMETSWAVISMLGLYRYRRQAH